MRYMIITTISVESNEEEARKVFDTMEGWIVNNVERRFKAQSFTRILTEEEYLKEIDNGK